MKSYKYLYPLYIFLISIFLSSCSINKQLVTLQDSKNIGFTSDGSYVLQNPPDGKARIYVYRDNNTTGSYLGYTLRIEYEPKRNSRGRPKYENYQDSLGYLMTGRTFFVDVWSGYPVAISAKTEATSYLLFTPMEGQIYCIKGSMRNGWTMPRPDIRFVDKITCEEAWIDYFKGENIEFQNKWRNHYNENAGRILIDSPYEKAEKAKAQREKAKEEGNK